MKNIKQRGFTLIELLIVITIIGILAVTGLSLLNPVEMIKRTHDNTAKTSARQILDGTVTAYLNDQRIYCDSNDNVVDADGNPIAVTACTADPGRNEVNLAADPTIVPFTALVDDLTGDGIIKNTAARSVLYEKVGNASRLGDNADEFDVLVAFDYDADVYQICFVPLSKAGKAEAGTDCAESGFAPGTGEFDCYLCFE